MGSLMFPQNIKTLTDGNNYMKHSCIPLQLVPCLWSKNRFRMQVIHEKIFFIVSLEVGQFHFWGLSPDDYGKHYVHFVHLLLQDLKHLINQPYHTLNQGLF